MWASWLPQRRRLQLLQCPWRAVATRRDWRSRSTLAPAASFPAMGLHASLLDALEKQGIAAPSPIQAAAIPPVAHGRSCAVQSHTGSGKTLAYLLPILSGALGRMHRAAAGGGRLPAKEHLHALVVTPSKDLALQVAQVARVSRMVGRAQAGHRGGRGTLVVGADSLNFGKTVQAQSRGNFCQRARARALQPAPPWHV